MAKIMRLKEISVPQCESVAHRKNHKYSENIILIQSKYFLKSINNKFQWAFLNLRQKNQFLFIFVENLFVVWETCLSLSISPHFYSFSERASSLGSIHKLRKQADFWSYLTPSPIINKSNNNNRQNSHFVNTPSPKIAYVVYESSLIHHTFCYRGAADTFL